MALINDVKKRLFVLEPNSVFTAAVALFAAADMHTGIKLEEGGHQDIQGWRDAVEKEIGEGGQAEGGLWRTPVQA